MSREERGGCPLTCPGLRLETSPKCAGERSIWLGEFPPPTPQRELTWRKHRCICPSVLRLKLPEPGGGRAPRFRLLGSFFWAAGPCVPRGVRPPPASGCPQRHHPFWSPVPELRLHSLEPERGHASPGAAAGQPFPRGPRRAGRPEVAGTGGEGPPPLVTAGASGRLGRGTRGSNLPRLGALASSLSAWAAAAATAPGAPLGVRLRAASAGPDSLRPAPPPPALPGRNAEGRRSPEPDLHPPLLAAPTPAPGTQLVPEKPESSPGASAAPAPRERAQPRASSPASRARQPDSPSAGRKSLGVTCRWRMKPPKRTLPPPHVALTHISSSLECEIKACAPRGGFGPRPLPFQVNKVCVMRWF